jgi:sarcosine oxidase delta subunit
MLSLLLCLKIHCTGCGDPIEATLQCEGQGVADREDGGAAVKIVCPWCGVRNQVIFTSDGTIHGVMRARTYERIPVMSVN